MNPLPRKRSLVDIKKKKKKQINPMCVQRTFGNFCLMSTGIKNISILEGVQSLCDYLKKCYSTTFSPVSPEGFDKIGLRDLGKMPPICAPCGGPADDGSLTVDPPRRGSPLSLPPPVTCAVLN